MDAAPNKSRRDFLYFSKSHIHFFIAGKIFAQCKYFKRQRTAFWRWMRSPMRSPQRERLLLAQCMQRSQLKKKAHWASRGDCGAPNRGHLSQSKVARAGPSLQLLAALHFF